MSEIPECSKHKIPMDLIKSGSIMDVYTCGVKDCNVSIDIITINIKGQEIYIKKQKETAAKIKNRNIKNSYKEKMF